MKNNKAFSLVELLVVMAIIGILAGIIFRLFAVSIRTAAEADTIAILEKVANGCAEYNAEYGEYPPTTTVAYEYENGTNQSPWFRFDYLPENNDFTDGSVKPRHL